MPFVTVRVSSASRGTIYERDYSLDVVFGPFVKTKISHMVGLGLLKEGDEYWASITPKFDDRENFDDLIWEVPRETIPKPGQGWLVMQTDRLTEGEPMKYFTLELHLLRTDACWYRKSFPLGELDYRTKQEKTTLTELGAIGRDDAVAVDYLPAAGDVMRAREILHMPEDLASLGSELIIEAVNETQFAEKPMPKCNCGHGGEERGKTIEIFFRSRDFDRLRRHIAKYATRSVESGGILIGGVYRQPDGGQLYIEVEDFIPAEKTAADAVSLRFTHDTWQHLIDQKRERFREEKRVVGWYHTHPPIPVTMSGKRLETVCFFSRDDENVQRQFFSEPWQIGVVMDGGSEEFGVFRWQESTIVLGDSHFFDDEETASSSRSSLNA